MRPVTKLASLCTGVAMLVISTATAGAQQVAAPAKLIESGKLTYGTAATFRPFEYMADGQLTGFDIDFGAHLAGLMGLQPNPMSMEFGGLIPALQSGRMDIINSAMYIKPQRQVAA